jgi:hypothetical protein
VDGDKELPGGIGDPRAERPIKRKGGVALLETLSACSVALGSMVEQITVKSFGFVFREGTMRATARLLREGHQVESVAGPLLVRL